VSVFGFSFSCIKEEEVRRRKLEAPTGKTNFSAAKLSLTAVEPTVNREA
jgi:hypothetical protein